MKKKKHLVITENSDSWYKYKKSVHHTSTNYENRKNHFYATGSKINKRLFIFLLNYYLKYISRTGKLLNKLKKKTYVNHSLKNYEI